MRVKRLYLFSLIAVLAIASLVFPIVGFTAHAEPVASSSLDAEAMSALSSCIEYAEAHDFSVKLTGTVKARVFGIPYTQTVYGTRVKSGDSYCETVESISAFVKAALKKTVESGKYFAANGKIKRGKAHYSAPVEYSRDEFRALYGKPDPSFLPYVTDDTVLSARKAGEGVFEFELSPDGATALSRNSVKTMLGGKSYPSYSSVSVTLTVRDGKPFRTECREKFRINKFGGTNCSAVYIEEWKH